MKGPPQRGICLAQLFLLCQATQFIVTGGFHPPISSASSSPSPDPPDVFFKINCKEVFVADALFIDLLWNVNLFSGSKLQFPFKKVKTVLTEDSSASESEASEERSGLGTNQVSTVLFAVYLLRAKNRGKMGPCL